MKDARFFCGDRLDCGAKVFAVIQANVGDAQHGPVGVAGGGIEAAAQAHLQHRQIHRGRGEMIHGHCSEQLEWCELMLPADGLPALQQRAQLVCLDPLIANGNPLAPTDQVRRAVEAGLEPRGLQDRPQGCAY